MAFSSLQHATMEDHGFETSWKHKTSFANTSDIRLFSGDIEDDHSTIDPFFMKIDPAASLDDHAYSPIHLDTSYPGGEMLLDDYGRQLPFPLFHQSQNHPQHYSYHYQHSYNHHPTQPKKQSYLQHFVSQQTHPINSVPDIPFSENHSEGSNIINDASHSSSSSSSSNNNSGNTNFIGWAGFNKSSWIQGPELPQNLPSHLPLIETANATPTLPLSKRSHTTSRRDHDLKVYIKDIQLETESESDDESFKLKRLNLKTGDICFNNKKSMPHIAARKAKKPRRSRSTLSESRCSQSPIPSSPSSISWESISPATPSSSSSSTSEKLLKVKLEYPTPDEHPTSAPILSPLVSIQCTPVALNSIKNKNPRVRYNFENFESAAQSTPRLPTPRPKAYYTSKPNEMNELIPKHLRGNTPSSSITAFPTIFNSQNTPTFITTICGMAATLPFDMEFSKPYFARDIALEEMKGYNGMEIPKDRIPYMLDAQLLSVLNPDHAQQVKGKKIYQVEKEYINVTTAGISVSDEFEMNQQRIPSAALPPNHPQLEFLPIASPYPKTSTLDRSVCLINRLPPKTVPGGATRLRVPETFDASHLPQNWSLPVTAFSTQGFEAQNNAQTIVSATFLQRKLEIRVIESSTDINQVWLLQYEYGTISRLLIHDIEIGGSLCTAMTLYINSSPECFFGRHADKVKRGRVEMNQIEDITIKQPLHSSSSSPFNENFANDMRIHVLVFDREEANKARADISQLSHLEALLAFCPYLNEISLMDSTYLPLGRYTTITNRKTMKYMRSGLWRLLSIAHFCVKESPYHLIGQSFKYPVKHKFKKSFESNGHIDCLGFNFQDTEFLASKLDTEFPLREDIDYFVQLARLGENSVSSTSPSENASLAKAAEAFTSSSSCSSSNADDLDYSPPSSPNSEKNFESSRSIKHRNPRKQYSSPSRRKKNSRVSILCCVERLGLLFGIGTDFLKVFHTNQRKK